MRQDGITIKLYKLNNKHNVKQILVYQPYLEQYEIHDKNDYITRFHLQVIQTCNWASTTF